MSDVRIRLQGKMADLEALVRWLEHVAGETPEFEIVQREAEIPPGSTIVRHHLTIARRS